MANLFGWAGTAGDFEKAPTESVVSELHANAVRLGMGVAETQLGAWQESVELIRTALRKTISAEPSAMSWGVVFEYALPFEGGRRPDVVLLAGRSVYVVEFKQDVRATQAALDQVKAYARDLADYHSETAGLVVTPILVVTRAQTVSGEYEPVVVSGAAELHEYLIAGSPEVVSQIDWRTWVEGDYEPLPTLVAAARRVFREEPLPHVRSAQSSGVPRTLKLLAQITSRAETEEKKHLVFVDGVPGSGKTLVGLRFIYELPNVKGRGVMLSGNGPLVAVLQHALKSTVFVRDLHKFIESYGMRGRAPREHAIVFDEAQRAWDQEYLAYKRRIPLSDPMAKSEPQFLIGVGEKLQPWAVLVGLVGTGQEIHTGEEAGIGQWRDAIQWSTDPTDWVVHCSPALADSFEGLAVEVHPELSLSTTLRSHRAKHLHDWVDRFLEGSIPLARRSYSRLESEAPEFAMYVTRDLDVARDYARARYVEEPEKRYGLLAPSRAKAPQKYGVDNGFQATKVLKVGPWFNDEPTSPLSCCQLAVPVTEFQIQGLEIDLPVLCWGEDMLWSGKAWEPRPARTRYPKDDPVALLKNAYRVLLSRGRDGLVVFVPPDESFDATEVVMLAAGFRPLEVEAQMTPPATGRVVGEESR